jgi:uncharacterized protein
MLLFGKHKVLSALRGFARAACINSRLDRSERSVIMRDLYRVRLGLISDTHMPKRWKRLPDTVKAIFAGVDLILHAGDVGELWVLDELSQIAPVVAVHGNDETEAAKAALPYLQTIVAAGQRIVLTHGFYRDPEQEAAMRRDNRWLPKFDFIAGFGKAHGANVAVFGHSHVPMVTQHEGVWLVNPGAIASGSLYTRQAIQTVAVMTLESNMPPAIRHIDLARPQRAHTPSNDWDAGFIAFRDRYSVPIFDAELLSQVDWIRQQLVPIATLEVIEALLLPLAHECWSGERAQITAADVVAAVAEHPPILAKLSESPVFARYC